jgi:hypothetical protein
MKLFAAFVSDARRMREAGYMVCGFIESCLDIVPELSETMNPPSCGFSAPETRHSLIEVTVWTWLQVDEGCA